MRSAQLAHKNKLASRGVYRLKQLSPGPSPLAGFDVTTEGSRSRSETLFFARLWVDVIWEVVHSNSRPFKVLTGIPKLPEGHFVSQYVLPSLEFRKQRGDAVTPSSGQ
jgi:hypothetical protein